MKTVCIYDDYSISSGSGVGTFLKDFAQCATQWKDTHICMIMFRTNVEEFSICMRGELEYFLFPKTFCVNPFEECEEICSLLKQYIPDSDNTFFLFNYVPCDKLMRMTRNYFLLSKQICVIHEFSWTTPLLGDVTLFRKLISKTKEKISFCYEGIIELYRREAEQCQMADRVVCLSEDTYDILYECYQVPKEKIALISHGMRTIRKSFSEMTKRKWKQKYYLNPDEKLIVMVGRICKSKGMFAYLEAFKNVLKYDSNCRLVVIGDLCNAPDLLAAAGEAVSKVTLTGRLDKELLSYWYRMADIGVIPSYAEQCCYVGLEMMCYGLPIIASDGFGVKRMFPDGVNAYVAPIGNRRNPKEFVQNLVDCTLKLLSNSAEQRKTKNNARRILKEKYNFSEMAEHYKAIFMA